jgi:hypothetical protein
VESAMNIEEIFRKYEERKSDVIKLNHGFIGVILNEVANSNYVLRFSYQHNLELYYKIIIYFKRKNIFFYTFIDGEMIEGKENMMGHAKEAHPEFFEWMIWNLP